MSFFDEFPRPDPPEHFQPPKRQPWQGPEPDWIGGWVPWRLVLYKTRDAFAVLRDFEAYPTGLQFSTVSTYREDPAMAGQRMMLMHRGIGGPRFGVEFSDGRRAAVGIEFPPYAGRVEPDRPVLFPQGGGGGGGIWRQGFWLWPLPPAGPLSFVTSWEERGIPEQSVVVDASVLESAAGEAEKLWDAPENGGVMAQGGSVSSMGRIGFGGTSTTFTRSPQSEEDEGD